MASVKDFPAHGEVVALREGQVIFRPSGTNYELHLLPEGGTYAGPVSGMTDGSIRVVARKVWTVPSGGNFITPLFGPPKIIQGRVKYVNEQEMVVQAGTAVIVKLPAEEMAYDMSNGPIGVGSLVNVTVLPGATFEATKDKAD